MNFFIHFSKVIVNEKKFYVLTFLKIFSFMFYRGKKNVSYWKNAFVSYFKENDVNEKYKKLVHGMDNISDEYVKNFISNSKYWNKYLYRDEKKLWTQYDNYLMNQFESLEFRQPFPHLCKINKFLFYNQYGLKDLPHEILEKINGRDIIDAGGWLGDTTYLFSEMFKNSDIFVYEPVSVNAEIINIIAQKLNDGKRKIYVIPKGLGIARENITINFDNENYQCEIVSLDSDFFGKNIGLIKCDTEGFETKIIMGSKEVIKKYKPVLVIAIYHTPEDFFDLKDKILLINQEYKFMIRRSENLLPCADLVLIAY